MFIFVLVGCTNFVTLCKTPNTGLSSSGKTRLDKERLAQCQAEMVRRADPKSIKNK
jgi:hypothetical protein